MYILKYAIKNIMNSPIRNIIIGVIIAVISLICCMSLALLRVSDKAEKEALLKASVTARIIKGDPSGSIDTSYDLTYDEIKDFAGSDYVYDSYVSVRANVNIADNIDNFTLVAYNSDMAVKHFLFVDEIVVDGTMFSFSDSLNECIVTDLFAERYNYEIGETIYINSESDGQPDKFKIVGIYQGDEFTKNDILTSLGAFESMTDIDDQTEISSVFVFNNPDYIDPFRNYVTQNNTDEVGYRVLFSGVQKFREYFSPIKSTKNFAMLSFILSLLVGGSILIVLSIFNIQERKYEVGVLSAMGMPKKKIVSQFVTEMLAITSLCMIIGISASAPLSVVTARSMLSPRMYTRLPYSLRIALDLQEPGLNKIKIGYLPDGNSDKDLVALMNPQSRTSDKFKAVMNIEIVAKVIAVGLLLTIISSLGSIVFIVRFKPLEILSQRSA